MVEAIKIQKGFQKTELGVIPSDWNLISIEEMSLPNGLVRGPFGGALKKEFFVPKGYKVYEQRNAIYCDVSIGRYYINYSKFDELRRFEIKKGDFIVSCSGTIGRIYQIPGKFKKGVINQALLKITINDNQFSDKYFNQYFKWGKFQQRIIDNTQGGAMKNLIGMMEFKKTLIPLPPTKAEQTAIATALNDADALIAQLGKLIAKKRAIKQGAMQELLKPKEGWEVKKLGAVAHLQGGFAFKSDLFVEIGIPIIRISDVKNDKVDTSESVCYEPFNIPRDFIVHAGDVLIAMSGATTGKIGIYQSEKIAYLNQRVGKFVVKDYLRTDKVYISHLVRSEKFKENLIKEIAQGAQPNISGKQIENLELPILNKKTEQTRIAQILSDMDTEIEALENKLDKYKMIKQGMMQNLLTGRIRLV